MHYPVIVSKGPGFVCIQWDARGPYEVFHEGRGVEQYSLPPNGHTVITPAPAVEDAA
jgi:hypothetical protein